LHNGVIARGNVVLDSVLYLQRSLEFGVDTVVRLIVGEQPTERSPLLLSEPQKVGWTSVLTDPLVHRLPYVTSTTEAFQFLPAWATKG